jgi:nitrite reductase/ring-hydroxylating ferredoxin subunit
MPKFVPVATLAELPPGGRKIVVVGEREIALFNVAGTLFAIDNFCPHQGGPLADGWLDGTVVTCPWHAWCFELRTGKMTLGDLASVDVFDVQLEGSTITISSDPRS